MSIKILAINPGSTSTKIGVFEDEKLIFDKTLRHSTAEISQYNEIYDQKDFRRKIIQKVLEDNNFDIHTIDVVVGRGGLVKPIPGGTYRVNEALIQDLKVGIQGAHASNLGGIIAYDIATEIGDKPAFIVDPVVVDEMAEIARFSGHPDAPRTSIFHALNQKAIGKRYAKDVQKSYEELNLIIAHMGGGVTVGAHKQGQVVDVFNGLDGDGAFSPERSGGLPIGGLIRMCFSGKYNNEKEALKACVGQGGVTAYLGTNDMLEVEHRANEQDEAAIKVQDAFIYQVAKDIGAMSTVLEGKVDQILITGGVAYSKYVQEELARKTAHIAPFTAYPGEDELLALAQGALRVMIGEEQEKEY